MAWWVLPVLIAGVGGLFWMLLRERPAEDPEGFDADDNLDESNYPSSADGSGSSDGGGDD